MTDPSQPPIVPGPPQQPFTLSHLAGPFPPPRKPHWWRDLGSGGRTALVVLAVTIPLVAVFAVVGALVEPESSTTAATGAVSPCDAGRCSSPNPVQPAATPATTAPSPAASSAPPPKTIKPTPPPAHKSITARQWLQIAKNPKAHIGERIIVHGVVTQFDAATGNDVFRANVGGAKKKPEYGFVDYDTNTILGGDATALEKLVEDDLFTAKVTVLGAFDYDTQLGGSTTAPLLHVDSITITGSVAR